MRTSVFHPLTGMMAAAAVLALAGASSAAEDTNASIGTWALDIQKSKCAKGDNVQSETISISDAGGGARHYVIDLVEADGTKRHWDFTASSDGKPVSLSGDTDYADMVAVTQPKPHHTHLVLTKGGKRVEWDTFVASKDGKHAYGQLAGNDSGTRWKCSWVWSRQ